MDKKEALKIHKIMCQYKNDWQKIQSIPKANFDKINALIGEAIYTLDKCGETKKADEMASMEYHWTQRQFSGKNNPSMQGIWESIKSGASKVSTSIRKGAKKGAVIYDLKKEQTHLDGLLKKRDEFLRYAKIFGISTDRFDNIDEWNSLQSKITSAIENIKKHNQKYAEINPRRKTKAKWIKDKSNLIGKWTSVDHNRGLTYEIYLRNTSYEPYVAYQLMIRDNYTGKAFDGGFESTLQDAKDSIYWRLFWIDRNY